MKVSSTYNFENFDSGVAAVLPTATFRVNFNRVDRLSNSAAEFECTISPVDVPAGDNGMVLFPYGDSYSAEFTFSCDLSASGVSRWSSINLILCAADEYGNTSWYSDHITASPGSSTITVSRGIPYALEGHTHSFGDITSDGQNLSQVISGILQQLDGLEDTLHVINNGESAQ